MLQRRHRVEGQIRRLHELSPTRNPIQDTVMNACHTIGLRYHSTGLWASYPPSLFLPKEKVQVRFLATKRAPQYSKFGNRLKPSPQDLGFHLGTVTEVHTGSVTLQFSDRTTHTIKDPGLHRNEKVYTFQNPAISVRPRLAGRHELLTPPLLHPQEYILNPPPPRATRRSPTWFVTAWRAVPAPR